MAPDRKEYFKDRIFLIRLAEGKQPKRLMELSDRQKYLKAFVLQFVVGSTCCTLFSVSVRRHPWQAKMQELSRTTGRPANLCFKEANVCWARAVSASGDAGGSASSDLVTAIDSPGKEGPAVGMPMVTPSRKGRRSLTSTPMLHHVCSNCGHSESLSPGVKGPTRRTNKKQRRDGGNKHEAEPVVAEPPVPPVAEPMGAEPVGAEPPVPPVTDGGEERAPSATLAASVALASGDDEELGMNFDALAD